MKKIEVVQQPSPSAERNINSVASKNQQRIARVLFYLAVLCLALSIWRGAVELSFMKASAPVTATVISVTQGGRVPVIEFLDVTGQAHRFSPNSSWSFIRYEVAQQLRVRVSTADSVTAKIDSAFYLWDTAFIFLWMAVVSGGFGALTRSGKLVWGPLKQKRLTLS